MSDKKEFTILFGKTDSEIVSLEVNIGERDYFSVSGHTYDKELLTEEEGEQRAKEYMEDGEQWKMAVAAGNTTDSMEEWNESVINMDGWQSVLGDIEELKNGKFASMSSCGQIDAHLKIEQFEEFFIPEKDAKFLWECWTNYHLKPLKEMPKNILRKLKALKKYESSIADYDDGESNEED